MKNGSMDEVENIQRALIPRGPAGRGVDRRPVHAHFWDLEENVGADRIHLTPKGVAIAARAW
jgi:hypothetical protein